MDLTKLKQILQSEPSFRLKQAEQAVFNNLIGDWQEAKTLPAAIREKLNQDCPLSIEVKIFSAKDKNSIKALFTFCETASAASDKVQVEAVLLRHGDGRNTVCVSSQAGCPLGCLFCATGRMGFNRNLSAAEIVGQVLFFARYLKNNPTPTTPSAPLIKGGNPPRPLYQGGNRVTNIVFMGMGEPLLNFDNVIGAIKIFNDKNYFNIGARHISVSTVGVAGGIKKLSREPLQINLAVSLHAPNSKLRSEIIPYNKIYSLKDLLADINDYIKETNRKVMIEYMMIKDFNDKAAQARELAELLKAIKPPLFFVNLISHNPTGEYRPADKKSIDEFKKILLRRGVDTSERFRFGREIKAACGQLAGETL